MTFYDVRLPDDIERGAVGGPGFKTTILPISSGFEKRNIDWSKSKGKWNISYGITVKSELDAVIEQFYVSQGRAAGFRFKDWSDFQIGDTLGGNTATKQSIGTGDGVTAAWQVFKLYSISVATYSREIFKLVQGTTRVFVGGVEVTSMENVNYVVGYNTGVITFQPGHIPGTAASNTLQIPVNPSAGETVVIGTTTYKFVAALTGAANEVLIGANAAASVSNLIAAVTAAAGIGATYGLGTVANAFATATNVSGNILFTAIAPYGGVVGNTVTATETLAGVGNVFANADGFLNGGVGADISVMTEFDVPVRFDTDDLQINTQVFSSEAVIELPQINIVETRDIA